MFGTVDGISSTQVWVKLDGDCSVPLLPSEFERKGFKATVGQRVDVEVGDIHCSLRAMADIAALQAQPKTKTEAEELGTRPSVFELAHAIEACRDRPEVWMVFRRLAIQRDQLLQAKPEVTRSCIPHNALCYFQDGDQWCCVFGDFVDLQVSPAGFGDTPEEALDGLKMAHEAKVETYGS